MDQALKEKLVALPREPGVYLMKDGRGRIIYVGKAKGLRARVGSYFTGKPDHFKTAVLVKEIQDFEVILTKTEVEALLLERTLIKHHQPPFNILLRDDKEYPYLRIDRKAEWPRIQKVRKRKDDGALYLGPFGSATFLKVMLDAAYRIFPLIRCSPYEFANAKRPCNYYHMKMCLGPCTLPVSREAYLAMVDDAVAFLQGRNKELAQQLRQKMKAASEKELYEIAATYRDQLAAFESITERQAVVALDTPDADVIGLAQDESRASIHVLIVREGKIIGSDGFVMSSDIKDGNDVLTQFLLQYYDNRTLPGALLLPMEWPGIESLRDALVPEAERPSAKFKILCPQRGPKHDIVMIAHKNAQYRLDEAVRLGEQKRAELDLLKETLGLTVVPRRIECIDISNMQETAIVASDVCFIDGKPAKDLYRHYLVHDVRDTSDDYASIREVVKRRIDRGLRDGDMPDLLVIDGGRGQLKSALQSAGEYRGLDLAIVGLAKSRVEGSKFTGRAIDTSDPRRSFERVFLPGQAEPIPLAPGSAEYRLLTQLRDEAHRFAITHHRKRRAKVLHGSSLESIPGVGPTLRKRLLEAFGGLDGLRNASLEQLKEIKGLREDAAVAIHSQFQGQVVEGPEKISTEE